MAKFGHIFFGYIFFIGITAWVIGFFAFSLTAIGLKYSHKNTTDAIIVLTGGSDRIATGIDLLQQNMAQYLFISGVNQSVKPNIILTMAPPELQNKIILGYIADSTHTNAIETAAWITENDIHSVLLVTSFYHMPRSLLEMKKILPNLKMVPYSIFPKTFNESTHWLHTKYAWQLFLEYHKFLITYVRYLF